MLWNSSVFETWKHGCEKNFPFGKEEWDSKYCFWCCFKKRHCRWHLSLNDIGPTFYPSIKYFQKYPPQCPLPVMPMLVVREVLGGPCWSYVWPQWSFIFLATNHFTNSSVLETTLCYSKTAAFQEPKDKQYLVWMV